MTVPAWSIPTFLTAAIFVWMVFMPLPPRQGDYDFGQALSAMFRLAVFIILTLVFWLIYFMAKSAS
jgi:hypothetical protein